MATVKVISREDYKGMSPAESPKQIAEREAKFTYESTKNSANKIQNTIKQKKNEMVNEELSKIGVNAPERLTFSTKPTSTFVRNANGTTTIKSQYDKNQEQAKLVQQRNKVGAELAKNNPEYQALTALHKQVNNEKALAKYNYDLAKEENREITFLDRTLGVPYRAVRDFFNLDVITDPEDNRYYAENGTYLLPTATQIRQERVRNSYGDDIFGKAAQFGTDVVYNVTKVGVSSALNKLSVAAGIPVPVGSVMYFSDMGIDSLNSALQQGYSGESAAAYALVNVASEMVTEYALGGLSDQLLKTKGGSLLGKKLGVAVGKVFKNDTVRSAVTNAMSEGVEEFVQEYIEKFSQNLILEQKSLGKTLEDTFTEETLQDALYSTLVGMGSGGLFGAVQPSINTNNTGIKPKADKQGNINIDSYATQLQEALNNTKNQNTKDNINQTLNYLALNKALGNETVQSQTLNQNIQNLAPALNEISNIAPQNIDTNVDNSAMIYQNYGRNAFNNNEAEVLPGNGNDVVLPRANQDTNIETQIDNVAPQTQIATEQRLQYAPTSNEKVNNLYNTASQYFNNSEQTTNLMNTLSKVVKDKGYNIVFSDEGMTTKNGTINGKIETKNGETTITLNPNSPRAFEFVVVHEITHAIETSSLKNMIMAYAKKNGEFNAALDSLKKTYGTNDVTSEVIADISGQLLGNQEFINNLSMEQPGLFKRLYNNIKAFYHKLRGWKSQDEFVQDLMNKWEYAYATQQNNLKNQSYSKEEVKVTNDLNEYIADAASREAQQNELNRQSIRESIEDYISDNNIKNPTIEDMMNSMDDYNMMDAEADMSELNKAKKLYREVAKELYNEKYASKVAQNEKVVYNTIQEAIDADPRKEAFAKYNTSLDFFNLDYDVMRKAIKIGSQYALEAQRNGLNNYSFNDDNYVYYFDILNKTNNAFGITDVETINSEVRSDVNERFTKQNNGLLTNNTKNEQAISNSNIKSIENTTTSKNNANLFTREQNIENRQSTKEKSTNIKGELDNSSFSLDNLGNKLSKQQQNYFKNSKVRDDNGNLLQVYHGTSKDFTVFDKSKIGTNTYNDGLFGRGFYFTNLENLAEGYSKYHEGNPNVKNGYLNLENPFNWNSIKTEEQMQQFIKNNNIPEGVLNWNRYQQEIHTITDTAKEAEFTNALKKAGYDGVIYTYRQQDENHAPVKEIVAFESNQFKNADNTSPTTNEDIRYSKNAKEWNDYLDKEFNKETTKYSINEKTGKLQDSKGKDVKLETSNAGTTGSLMAIHNLSAEKLQGILELGGFPVPSIAITTTDNTGNNQFGNISVLFDKNTIDPANKLNEVYDRDVWTPTFPKVEYDIDNSMIRQMSKDNKIYDNNEDGIISHARLNYMYSENLSDLIDRNGLDGAITKMKGDNELKYLYLKSKDNNYQPQLKRKNYSDTYTNETLQKFVDNFKWKDMSLADFYYHYLNYGDMDLTDDQRTALKATVRDTILPEIRQEARNEYNRLSKINKTGNLSEDAFVNQYTDMMLESFDESYFKYKDFIRDASRLSEGGETQTIDEDATLKQVEKDVNQKDYEKWIDNTFGKMLKTTKKGIRNDKDMFTSSGNRRSFNQLHENYDLANIVKYMTSQRTVAGEQGFGAGSGFGTIQAQMSNKFNTIDDIRNSAKERIRSYKEGNDFLKPYSDAIYNDMEQLVDYYKFKDSKYNYPMDTAGYVLNDFAGYKKQDINNLKKVLTEYDFEVNKIPNKILTKTVDDINSLRNIPTDYFEAKPQRAVGLDEIQQIVLPNNTDVALKQELQNRGISYSEYDPNIEGDRQRVVNQFDNLKFSKNNKTWQQYLEENYVSRGTKTYGKDIRQQETKNKASDTYRVKQVLDSTPDTAVAQGNNVLRAETRQDNSRLTKAEISELNELNAIREFASQEELARLEYLENKRDGLIKYPDLKQKVEFKDISKEYTKYKNNIGQFDPSLLNQAEDTVKGYRNTKTKEQWLDVAEQIGSNFKGTGQELTNYAVQSWFEARPNDKNSLNRQGKGYVKFSIDEWVNSVYKGAKVGEITTRQEAARTTIAPRTETVETTYKGNDVLRNTNNPFTSETLESNRYFDINGNDISETYKSTSKGNEALRTIARNTAENRNATNIEATTKYSPKEISNMFQFTDNENRVLALPDDVGERLATKTTMTPTEVGNLQSIIDTAYNTTVEGNSLEMFSDYDNKIYNIKAVKQGNTYVIEDVVKTTRSKLGSIAPNTSQTANETTNNNVLRYENQNRNIDEIRTDYRETVENASKIGESKFYKNATQTSEFLTEDNRAKLSEIGDLKYYEKVANEESLDKASKRLREKGTTEALRWLQQDNKVSDASEVAEGWILLKNYQDAGDFDSMVAVAKKMRQMGTTAGQAIQAYNIMQRLTPEGMVKYAQGELSEAYEAYAKNKSKSWVDQNSSKFDLTAEEVGFIVDTMKQVEQTTNERAKKVKLGEIQKMLTNKLPPERGSGIKAWMRISMLFNPKTQIRNIMGNAVITPVNLVGDYFASKADALIAKKTGIRTTGTTDIKSYAKGFKQGLFESYDDFKRGINTRNIDGNRFELGQAKSFSDKNAIGRTFNKIDALNSFLLDAGDRGFYEAAFTNSINNQLVLNNTTKVTQDMIDIATSEALQRTWQDNNNYTKFVLNTRNMLNKINIRGYGLGDILIPFAKTPANLTKAIVDYSPAGMVNAIIQGKNLKNAISTGTNTAAQQHQFAQTLGKATAGTMLYVIAYGLAKAGIASGESDDDKDTRDFIKNTLGISSYSIKIGNKSFTYDWAQPIAAPLSIMTNIVNSKNNKGQALLEAIVSSLDSAGSVLLEQSFVKSINDVLTNNDGVVSGLENAILDLPTRAVPTFLKQITDMTDGTQRQTYEYQQPLKTEINKIKAKIPGLSQTLQPAVDTMGREIQKYGGKNNIFNVFLNPANVNTTNISSAAKEIYRVYKETGDKTIMPRVAPYYINSKGEKTILNTEERKDFQKISGNIIESAVNELKTNESYNAMSDSDKADVINNVVNYSYNKARKDVLGMEMSNEYNKVNEWLEKGGTVASYYANREEVNYSLQNPTRYNALKGSGINYYDYEKYQNEVTRIKKEYAGTNNANIRKQKVANYINSLNATANQKIILFKLLGNYSIKNYSNTMYKYINSFDMTSKEKKEIWNALF